MNKDFRHIELKIYESSTQLRVVPDERPNVTKVTLQRVAKNKKGEWYYKSLKSFRLTRSQAMQLKEAVDLLTSETWLNEAKATETKQ